MRDQHTVLRLEELGDRVLPSSTVPTHDGAPVAHIRVDDSHNPGHPGDAIHVQPSPHTQASDKLHGVGGGYYFTGVKTPDAGTESRLYGQAYLGGLGEVTVTGTVWSVGMIAEGHAGGTLTFRNDHGSVTIALDGPKQAGFSHLPSNFHYEVIEGTGAYAHFHDHGQIHLDLDPSHLLGGPHPGGDFTLQIGSHQHAHHHK